MMHRRTLLQTLSASALLGQKLPNVGLKADSSAPRSECGVGALMAWADSLWAVTYNSHKARTGTNLWLYRIDEDLKAEPVERHDGTHANRLIHRESSQCFIGPFAIDAGGKVRAIKDLFDHRLTATFRHLTDPANRVYCLTMEGLLYEVDVSTLKATLAVDVLAAMNIKARPHFKGGFTAQGRVVIANNGFYLYGDNDAGLFEYDGKAWRALSRKPHMDVAARQDMGSVLFCTGWDELSVLLWALVEGKWQTYRLPKASHVYQHAWQTEWMRIREVETEHFLMDIHGMFYELQPIAFQGRIWGVKPICQHLRTIPDYTSFRGLLALGGNQGTPNNDNYALGGQPQSGIWFGKTDDLWSWGKPAGWGGVWRNTVVNAGQRSDPLLMTGFGRKVLHLKAASGARFGIEIDFVGDGSWVELEEVRIAGGYRAYVFPDGFSAHWVRLRAESAVTATAEFHYT
jgi:hypothetical protein